MARLSPLRAWALALCVPQLAAAATVSGEVRGFPDGEPLPGIEVLVRDPLGYSALAVTGPDGAFVVEGVDPGEVRIQARVPASQNRIGAYLGDVDRFCAAQILPLEERLDGLRLELPTGGSIEVAVVDAGGAPRAATVQAEGAGALEQGIRRDGIALGEGYLIQGLSSYLVDGEPLAGAYLVSASLPGEPALYAPGTWSRAEADLVPALRGEVSAARIERPLGSQVQGVLLDPSGAPAAGAEVEVLAGGLVVWQGLADPDGAFVAEDLPGDGFLVRARAEGAALSWYPGDPRAAGAETLEAGEIALEPWSLGAAGALRLALPGIEAGSVRLSLADEAGSSSVVLAAISGGEASFASLPAGSWQARVEVEGFASGAASVLIEPEIEESVELTLTPLERVSLVVRARGGATVRGARVEAISVGGEVLASTLTGDGGEGSLLVPGPALLRARWEPFCAGDPRRVERWSGDARSAPFAEERGEGDQETFTLPPDRDRDAMDDAWELLWGLDPQRDDGGEDPDADGLVNREEYAGYTDPLDREPSLGCSLAGATPTCEGAALGWILLLPLGVVAARRPR